LHKPAWRRRRGFWTSVHRIQKFSAFSWCDNTVPVDLPLNSPYWAAGAPNLTENNECVHGNLLRYNATFSLSNAPCNKTYLWSCQVFTSHSLKHVHVNLTILGWSSGLREMLKVPQRFHCSRCEAA
jgi:hypothetical protein